MTTPLPGHMIQHAVASGSMTNATDRERQLVALVRDLAQVKEREHELLRQRNDLMREMNARDGVHPKRLRELTGLRSLPLTYRIVNGEDR